MKLKISTEDFIKRANIIHNNKYDYSRTEYKKSLEKVIIICPIHGEFLQKPNDHYTHGCKECGYEKNSNMLKKTIKEFIEEANIVHESKYDYSKVEYKKISEKANIICPIHGEFLQEINSHLQGAGCPKCCKRNFPYSTKEFIERANIVHENKYDYSLVNYINAFTKIEIICKKHGKFLQNPGAHIYGQGCSKCRASKGERSTRLFLQKNGISFEEQKKFQDCKNIKPLYFDFYLPEYNACIEYQGKQHYNIENCWGGEKEYERRLKNDNIKKEYCINKKIKFFEILYNENINDKFKEIINEIKNK